VSRREITYLNNLLKLDKTAVLHSFPFITVKMCAVFPKSIVSTRSAIGTNDLCNQLQAVTEKHHSCTDCNAKHKSIKKIIK